MIGLTNLFVQICSNEQIFTNNELLKILELIVMLLKSC